MTVTWREKKPRKKNTITFWMRNLMKMEMMLKGIMSWTRMVNKRTHRI